jgi:hypothetical protein
LIEVYRPIFDKALAGTPAHGIIATLAFPTVLSSGQPELPGSIVQGIGKVRALVVLDAGDLAEPKRQKALTRLHSRLVFPKTF